MTVPGLCRWERRPWASSRWRSLPGGALCAIDDGHRLAEIPGDGPADEGVVGAPQDDVVHTAIAKGEEEVLEVAVQHGPVEEPALHHLRQTGAGQGDDVGFVAEEGGGQLLVLVLPNGEGVAMTITEELPTSRAAGFTAGSMPMMGRSGWAWRRRWMAALVAVLQATTTAFTPWARSRSTAAMVRRRTWARDFSP